MIAKRLEAIDKELSGAITSGKIKLIAVTKSANDNQVLESYEAGVRDFGENYVLPALRRIEKLKDKMPDSRWHLLGPLQTNKINKIFGNFAWIHSVHNSEIAEEISERATKFKSKQRVLIQINSTGDKHGFSFEEFAKFYPLLDKLPGLQIEGLMTMGFFKAARTSETIYNRMRQSIEIMQAHHPGRRFELSMGMSNDYRVAANYGATMIRIGRGLFNS